MINYIKKWILNHMFLKEYIKFLCKEENSIMKGYSNGRFYPYSSLEGGSDTIAYGHKLNSIEEDNNTFTVGITDKEAIKLLKNDIEVHYDMASKRYERMGYEWEAISYKDQLALTDIEFNVIGGISAYPTFTKAVADSNYKKAKRECIRYYTDTKGVRHKLGRNKGYISLFFGGVS